MAGHGDRRELVVEGGVVGAARWSTRNYERLRVLRQHVQRIGGRDALLALKTEATCVRRETVFVLFTKTRYKSAKQAISD